MTPRPEAPPPDPLGWLALVLGAPSAVVLWTALAGLARLESTPIGSAVVAATVLTLGPAALATSFAVPGRRVRAAGVGLALTAVAGLSAMPMVVPGRRSAAVVAGLSMGFGEIAPEGPVAATIREALPPESPPLAEAVAVAPPPEATVPIPQDAIVLPYEGQGRRLTVPVVFEQDGVPFETFMMLDTGATYTTLPTELLASLGALPGRDAPTLTLTTANGPREASVTLVDRVWLGDLVVPGVAVTPCDDCAGDGAAGLLGLNVASGFNVTIDADRREVVFHRRARFDRHLDIRPFTRIESRFLRYPSGRVEVHLTLDNTSNRDIERAITHVSCGEDVWRLVAGPIPAGEEVEITRGLPSHPSCDRYRIALEEGDWVDPITTGPVPTVP